MHTVNYLKITNAAKQQKIHFTWQVGLRKVAALDQNP